MTSTRGRTTPPEQAGRAPAQAGFALIEVLVSGVIAVVAAGAVFSLMQASTRTAADQRKRSEAYAVAQEDQARLRSMRIPELNQLEETREVTVAGTPFTVASTGAYANSPTGLATCGDGGSSADFIKIGSKVSWPNMGPTPPAEIHSIVAPPSGSLRPNSGTLTVMVTDGAEAGLAGVGLSGTGAGTFSGTTDANGCAVFPEQAAGEYTLTTSGGPLGIVDTDGNPPGPRSVTVNPGVTNAVTLQYAQGGTIPVRFQTRVDSGSLFDSTADSVIAFNSGMESGAKLFGDPGGEQKTQIDASPVFPFTSPVTVYAGSCTGNDPGTGNAASASVVVPAGMTAPVQTVQLPALNLTVWTGKNYWNRGSPYYHADVWIEDDNCDTGSGYPESPVTRRYSTNSSGGLDDPGLPWSSYDVCVDDNGGWWSGRRDRAYNVNVKNLSSGTSLDLYLGDGRYSQSESGSCP